MPRKKFSGVTIVDVAGLAGVSLSTVSRVLNQSAPVEPETEARVRAAIEELGYQPRAAARGLASGRMKALGLVATTVSIPFMAPLLQGVESAARELDYDLLIHATYGQPSPGPGYRRALGPHNVDGLIVFPGCLEDAEVAWLHEHGFPVVLLFRSRFASLDIPCVACENRESAQRLVSHLIEVHGRRHIALVRGPEGHEDFDLREAGYRAALGAHDLPYEPALVRPGGQRASRARAVVEAWLRQGIDLDAVVAFDDDAAMEAIHAIQEAGKRVPEDISVVGFDDVHFAHYRAPSLTTVHVPVEQVGREAVRQLIRLIETGSAERLTVLPTEVSVRRSCGCG